VICSCRRSNVAHHGDRRGNPSSASSSARATGVKSGRSVGVIVQRTLGWQCIEDHPFGAGPRGVDAPAGPLYVNTPDRTPFASAALALSAGRTTLRRMQALCQCGCGEPAPIAQQTRRAQGWVKGEPRPYVKGHHRRGKRLYDDGLTKEQRYYQRNRERKLAEAKERNEQNPDTNRGYRFKAKYGMSLKDFDRMYNEQAGCCAACEDPIPRRGVGVNVDHCHETGRVRGLLCRSCNAALGMLEENVDRIEALKRYAERVCGSASSLAEVGL
jgi:Recombination endonuclease VII